MKINEVIIVEGRYDKNALSQVVDATILETSGFGVINDKEKLKLIRRIAEKRGIIIMTDGDGAGFQIRNFLKGAIPGEYIKHAYIPDIEGREKRKKHASGDGLLGVEGMRPETLLKALENAGATAADAAQGRRSVTKADLYMDGLSGGKDSAALRQALLDEMGLPKKLSAGAMLDVINALYSYEQYKTMAEKIWREKLK